MIHEILHFFVDINFKTIFAMLFIFWFFQKRMKTQENRNEQRIDRIYEMFLELRKDIDEKILEVHKSN